jgi:hypothetical protein
MTNQYTTKYSTQIWAAQKRRPRAELSLFYAGIEEQPPRFPQSQELFFRAGQTQLCDQRLKVRLSQTVFRLHSFQDLVRRYCE